MRETWTPEKLASFIERVRLNLRGKDLNGEEDMTKTGGKSPRTKGFSFERECVRMAKEYGHEAKRTPCSRYPDLWIDNRPVSCKRRKAKFGWMYKELEDHEYILCRDDNQVILKIKKWVP